MRDTASFLNDAKNAKSWHWKNKKWFLGKEIIILQEEALELLDELERKKMSAEYASFLIKLAELRTQFESEDRGAAAVVSDTLRKHGEETKKRSSRRGFIFASVSAATIVALSTIPELADLFDKEQVKQDILDDFSVDNAKYAQELIEDINQVLLLFDKPSDLSPKALSEQMAIFVNETESSVTKKGVFTIDDISQKTIIPTKNPHVHMVLGDFHSWAKWKGHGGCLNMLIAGKIVKIFVITVVAHSKRADVALCICQTSSPLHFIVPSFSTTQEPSLIITSAARRDNTLHADEYITKITSIIEKKPEYSAISTKVFKGYSGSCVTTIDGRITGVVVRTHDVKSISYMINAIVIKEFLKKIANSKEQSRKKQK